MTVRSMAHKIISLAAARRIAIAAQHLDRPRPSKPTPSVVAATIERLGLLQIDPVNILAPAHEMVLFTRLGPFPRQWLTDAVYQRRQFTEQWAHEACIVPMSAWPLLAPRRQNFRTRPYGFEQFLAQHTAYSQSILETIREKGPMTAADFPAPAQVDRRMPEAWFGTVPRAVLEDHFAQGRLAVAQRLPNFARLYDLAERVIPVEHFSAQIAAHEADRELLRIAARGLGIATAADLGDYFRMKPDAVKPRVAELLETGELEQVEVPGWPYPAYLLPAARQPRKVTAARLLSPFDPLVWFRPRIERLFQFEYRLEIYTPPAKRRWGYYVLPFLFNEQLAARVDLKADRANRQLLVQSLHLEPGVPEKAVKAALEEELHLIRRWQELT